MITNFILAPILAHMITAVVLLFIKNKVVAQKMFSIIGSVIAFLLSFVLLMETMEEGFLILNAGNWKAPLGITFVSDTFSALLVLLTSLTGLAVSIYSTVGISHRRIKYGYYSIFHFLLMGLSGSFLTGDIFNLYVWFEVVIISSFVLLTLGGKRMQMEGAIKYVAMNMLASVIFLTAIGVLYGITGTLNMADLAVKIQEVPNKGLVSVTSLLFFVGFGIKSAVFPLYFWLPSSYHTPPSAIAAVFGGLLTKMGVYAMFRIFTLIFIPDAFTLNVFVIVALATMLTGAFGTINKKSIRRIFSYLIVCHIGYLIAGLGLYTKAALIGALFYIVHDIVVKSNLFLVSGLIFKVRGSTDIRRLGGFYKDYPKLSLLMAIVLFSLVGIPPLSGFWPKIQLFQEAFERSEYILLGSLIFASFVTLFVIARVWSEVFWKDSPKPNTDEIDEFSPLDKPSKFMLVAPIVILAGASLFIGLGAEHVYDIVERIATELLDRDLYIQAVLGKR